jgi:hypothetical protein
MKSGAPARASSRSAKSCRSGNPRDQRFFAVEVNVERPGTDRRRAADILHGRAVEAGVCNAALGSIQNVLAARLLRFRFELRHGFSLLILSFVPDSAPPQDGGHHRALHKTKRTVVLFAGNWQRRDTRSCASRARERRPVLTVAGDAPSPAASAGKSRMAWSRKEKGTSARCVGARVEHRSGCGGKAKPDLATQRASSGGVPRRRAPLRIRARCSRAEALRAT